MVALGCSLECGVRSIGDAESQDFEDCAVLIRYFNAPRPLVRFPELYDTVCGPLGRINPQSDLRAQLIPMKPTVIDHSALGNRIERGEAADLTRRDGECHALDYGVQVLNLFANGGLDKSWPLCLLLRSHCLSKTSVVLFCGRMAPQDRNQSGHSHKENEKTCVQSLARVWDACKSPWGFSKNSHKTGHLSIATQCFPLNSTGDSMLE